MRLLQQQERMIHKQVGNRILEFFNSVCKLTWFSLSSKRNKSEIVDLFSLFAQSLFADFI